jgi:hypothetical protein
MRAGSASLPAPPPGAGAFAGTPALGVKSGIPAVLQAPGCPTALRHDRRRPARLRSNWVATKLAEQMSAELLRKCPRLCDAPAMTRRHCLHPMSWPPGGNWDATQPTTLTAARVSADGAWHLVGRCRQWSVIDSRSSAPAGGCAPPGRAAHSPGPRPGWRDPRGRRRAARRRPASRPWPGLRLARRLRGWRDRCRSSHSPVGVPAGPTRTDGLRESPQVPDFSSCRLTED